MSTLIVYATKSGASQYCAEILTKQMEDCTVCDLSKATPDIASFDTVIIGSGVRMGKFYKPILNFIKKHEDLLTMKKTAFYLCNAYPDTLQKAIEKNIPQKLIKAAVSVKSFGGKPPFSSLSNPDWLLSENVKTFIQEVLHD